MQNARFVRQIIMAKMQRKNRPHPRSRHLTILILCTTCTCYLPQILRLTFVINFCISLPVRDRCLDGDNIRNIKVPIVQCHDIVALAGPSAIINNQLNNCRHSLSDEDMRNVGSAQQVICWKSLRGSLYDSVTIKFYYWHSHPFHICNWNIDKEKARASAFVWRTRQTDANAETAVTILNPRRLASFHLIIAGTIPQLPWSWLYK